MLNLLIAGNNDICKNLINKIIYRFEDIRLVQITNSEEETLRALNTMNIDIIILDYKILSTDIDNFYKKLKNDKKKKYQHSLIIILPNKDSKLLLNDNELILDTLFENLSIGKVIFKINIAIKNKNINKIREKIFNELKYLHYSIQYKGTHYLADVILYILSNKNLNIYSLQKQVYPIIANMYNQTENTIRCNITRATTCMYYECDSTILQEYFGLSDDEKPKVKEVVFTIVKKFDCN